MTTLPQFINEHGKRMVIVNKSIADMCRKEGIDMEKENIVESIPIDPKNAPAFQGTAIASTDDEIQEFVQAFDSIKPVTRSIVRNLTTSHKQHHTAPDGRRYVDTGKGWRRV